MDAVCPKIFKLSCAKLHFDSYAPVLSTSLHMSAINTTRSDMMRIEEASHRKPENFID